MNPDLGESGFHTVRRINNAILSTEVSPDFNIIERIGINLMDLGESGFHPFYRVDNAV